MGTLGMVVRCDQGGLGNQTYSLWKHLKPDVTLLLNLPGHKGRGKGDPGKYSASWTNVWPWRDDVIPRRMIEDLGRAVDTILTVETLYSGTQGFYGARESGARTVLVANPELFSSYPADVTVVPTPWELSRMPKVKLLPHPTEEPPATLVRQRHVCQTFLHVAAPAMLDRNGTAIVMAALKHVKAECQLEVHAPFMAPPWEAGGTTEVSTSVVGKVHVRWDPRPKRDYWSVYDVEADVMLLPRRYGGLCLPVQEAAACGMPAVMTDLRPQDLWPTWRVPARLKGKHAMKGGVFDVHDVNPVHLASMMNDLVTGEVDVEAMSDAATVWAKSISWSKLLDEWRAVCGLTS
jgi:glycosyltransferase involved in cell wall biosynthesis